MPAHSSPLILVVGAAGAHAGLVVPALVRRGARVRGFVHDAGKADAVREAGAADVVVGDLKDRASVEAALDGVERVFYIAPAFMDDEGEVGRQFVEAAATTGVERVVFSSVIHPVLGALPNHIGKVPVEEAILESGMDYAFFHPAFFLQNLDPGLKAAAETGEFAQPWSAETRFSFVDYRDVAEVAAEALTGDRLLYGTYQLCAEGVYDRHEIAAAMSEVLDREVRAGTTDPSEMGDGGPPDGMRAMFDWYDAHDLVGTAITLRAVLGREPTTLREYLEDAAERLGVA